MIDFGREHIPGFSPDLGYGFYEFTQEEYFKSHKRVILIHKVINAYYIFIIIKYCLLFVLRTNCYILELVQSFFVQKVNTVKM